VSPELDPEDGFSSSGREPGRPIDDKHDPGDGTDDGGSDEKGDDTGVDAVRAALNRARAAAKARPATPARSRRRSVPGRGSGAGPDARDPQLFSATIQRLVTERGWDTPVAVGGVMGRWSSVVGAEVAEHCRPESFTEGVLTVVAESTAWATQVRLLVPTLFRRLAEEVGDGTVTKIVVRGPQTPNWRRGPRVAPGSQGPRDTYG
jgi:predicted nucleic acid-binding Zn ribbon protein